MIALAALRLLASSASAIWRFLRTPYGQILAVVLIFGGLGWWHGERRYSDGVMAERGRWEARLAADAAKARQTEAKNAKAADGASVAVEKIRTVTQWRTKTIIERIPTDAPDPARPALPRWFVSLHDEAAVSELPGPAESAGQPDERPSTIGDADALKVIAVNYGACRFDQGRLAELQGLLKAWGMAE